MMKTSIRAAGLVLAACLVAVGPMLMRPAPARAGSLLEITEEIIARFLGAHAAEDKEKQATAPQVADLDKKIADWRDCAKTFQEAGDATGSKLGGFAAKMAMKKKCGATSDEGFVKDREKLMRRPTDAALDAGKFKEDEYNLLNTRILGWLNGATDGYSDAERTVLGAHKKDLLGALGSLVSMSGGGGGGGGAPSGGGMGMAAGGHIPASWAGDAAWGYIGYMFAVMYMSGANTFEKPYQPGEWTRWQLTDTSTPDEKTVIERALISTTPEGAEWWRDKSIITQGAVIDTVNLEGLFKPMDPQGTMKQLVRMRGKLPGDTEPHEMMVPQYMSMLTSASIFPMKPTPESVDGATVGTETVAGVTAKHVRFSGGTGGSTIEWWLADGVPGGWVKFMGSGKSSGEAKPATWTMEMMDKGTGAVSELGVK